MSIKEFYVTLPSNSSMNYFRDNSAAKFTTKLLQPIELDDESWVVGLVEIIFPMSFFNVQKGRNSMLYTQKDNAVMEELKLNPGHYQSMDHLLQYVNAVSGFRESITLSYNAITGHVISKVAPDRKLFLGPGIADILGYKSGESEIKEGRHMSPYNAKLFNEIPQQLYIYMDLLVPQIIGDTCAPLLRIVGIEDVTTFGKVIVKTYDNPHYVPLLKRRFESIEIELRDAQGKLAPFQYGPTTIKLHFIKR